MLKLIMTSAAFAMMTSTMAAATTLQLPPKGRPVATIVIPDNWTHKIEGDDYEAKSTDESVNIAVGTDEKLKTEAEIAKEAAKEAPDLEIVPGSMKSGNDHVNGMKAVVTHLDVKAKGSDQKVGITVTQIITPKPDVVIHVMLLNLSGSKEREAELDAIFSSLKLLN